MADETKTLGAKQVATRIGTDPRTFRKFLRGTGRAVGQGGRYDFPEDQLPALKTEFTKWKSGGFNKSALPSGPKNKPKRGDARELPSEERTDEEIEEAYLEEVAAAGEEPLDLDVGFEVLEDDDDLAVEVVDEEIEELDFEDE